MELPILLEKLRGKQLEISVGAKVKGKQRWTGAMNPPIADVALEYLGAGTNKMAFLVAGTTWVLCFGYNLSARRDAVLSDFNDEVNTMVRVGTQGVRVPKPFPSSPPSPSFIFEMKCYNTEAGTEGDVYAFLLEFMPSDLFVEMPKTTTEKTNFAKSTIVIGGRLPPTIAQTRADLVKICDAWKLQKWGDFQVMYHKMLGTLTVFDPQATDGIMAQHEAAMNQWLLDIDAAIALHAPKKPPSPAMKTRERSKTL